MGIVNKRNAVLGWLTWNVGKRVAKKKAKDVLPSRSEGDAPKGKKKRVKALALLAAAGGALAFWKRKRRERTDDDSGASE